VVTIIIPGYSTHNQKWLEDTASNIRTDGEIRPIYWAHWKDPSHKFDAKSKANLLDAVSGKRVVDIIAKSIGTLVASYLILKSPTKIRKVIFCGIPINDIDESAKEVIKTAVRALPLENIILLQNNEDPHGGIDALKGYLSEFGSDLKIVEKPGVDHEYFYQEDFNKFILS
jgi:pimeloyl-ACP methyl ester carboxylesterase